MKRTAGIALAAAYVGTVVAANYARSIGCTSADGTTLARFPSTIDRVLSWTRGGPEVVEVVGQAGLFEVAA